MEVKLNGERIALDSGPLSLPDFLRAQGLDPDQSGIAVAINFEVIPRSAWNEVTVQDGDAVEVIGAMQGG